MSARRWENVHIEEGTFHVSLAKSIDRDSFEINIWERVLHEKGSYHLQLGAGGLFEKVFVPQGEAVQRPTLEISTLMAPSFFRLMGMAADQLGVLPDVVAAQIAKLETEVKLLREMLERTDMATGDHIRDLRMMSTQVIHVPRSGEEIR